MLTERSAAGRAHVPHAADRRRARAQRDRVRGRSARRGVRSRPGRAAVRGLVRRRRLRAVGRERRPAGRRASSTSTWSGGSATTSRTVDYDALARRIDRSGADVLFVSAYLVDAVELRRALVRNDVDLLASIGTSSSYCMPEFGAALGEDAVGLFASDKPSGDAIDPSTLRPDGAALLERARAAYDERWHEEMSPAALAGFSAAWALFAEVMPAAARRRRALPRRDRRRRARARPARWEACPNGSGLRFGEPGTATAGDNLAAAAVIWEWMVPGEHMVVWPPDARHPRRARRWTSLRDDRRGRRPGAGRGDAPSRAGRRPRVRAAYAGLAAWSGSLTPLARGPAARRSRPRELPVGLAAAGARDARTSRRAPGGSTFRSARTAWAPRSSSRPTARSRS